MSEVFSILLHNRQRYEQGKEGLWFSLPTTTEKLQEALREIGISADNPQDFFLYDYRSPQERPIKLPRDLVLSADVDELNFLAARLEKLDAAELSELNAALTSPQSDFRSIGQIIDYPDNVDYYVHLPDVTGAVLELSPDALPYLRQNLHRHAPQLQCCAGDVLCPPAALLEQQYHIITCNPPYLTAADMEQLQPEVAHEPETALFGGTDGLDFYRKLTMLWKPALLPGGWLVYEVGAGQAADVEQIFRKNGYAQVHTVPDLTGIGRVVLGQKAEI